MGKLHLSYLVLSLAGAAACLDPPAQVQRGSGVYVLDRNAATAPILIATKEESGAAIAAVTASATRSQLVKAAANSQIAGSTVEFPAGSLTQDTEITMQASQSIAGTLGLVLNAAAAGDDTAPVTVAAVASALTIASTAKVDAAAPFTLTLSLPDSGLGLNGSGLVDPYERLLIVYDVHKYSEGDGKYVGLIPRDRIAIVDGYGAIATQWFGTYQAIITTTKVELPAQVDVPAATLMTETLAAEPASSAVEPEVPAAPVAPDETAASGPPADPVPAPRRLVFYQTGFLTASFATNEPRQDGFSALWHIWGPARVGSSQTLSTGLLTTQVEGE